MSQGDASPVHNPSVKKGSIIRLRIRIGRIGMGTGEDKCCCWIMAHRQYLENLLVSWACRRPHRCGSVDDGESSRMRAFLSGL